VSTSEVKWSEGLIKSVSFINRKYYTDHMKFAVSMVVCCIIFFYIVLFLVCITVYIFVCFVCFCQILRIMCFYRYVYARILIVMNVPFCVFSFVVLFYVLFV